jgi:general secretion pathway protein A
MFENFFSLRENPFNVSLDPRYLFPTRQTQEALQKLASGIQSRKGLILFTGEVGTGKTMLISQLLEWLRRLRAPTAFVFNPNLSARDLFYLMSCDFGIAGGLNDRANVQIRLNRWLFERYRAGVTPVLIVDEAQGLSFEGLEEIRLLLNVETPCAKLLQIVLAGQPELRDKLNRPEAHQLRQRIAVRCEIDPLTLEQTHAYIEQRLRIAGADSEPIFLREAMDAVYFYAGGIPRVINLICEHSLINAYVDHLRPVPVHIVEMVAREFQHDGVGRLYPTLTSSAATSNRAAIESILERAQTHRAAMHKSGEPQRAHAAAAGVSPRLLDVRSNNQSVSAFPDRQELSAAPSSSEAPDSMKTSSPRTVAPTPRTRWPSILAMPAPTPTAQSVSAATMTPALSPLSPAVPSRNPNMSSDVPLASECDQAVALHRGVIAPHEIRTTEEAAPRLRWTPVLGPQQALHHWWSVCRAECLFMVTSPTLRRIAPSLSHWVRQSMRRVRRPTKGQRMQHVQYRPDRVLILLYRCWPRRLQSYLADTVQTTRQRITPLYRWLQEPLSSAHRR